MLWFLLLLKLFPQVYAGTQNNLINLEIGETHTLSHFERVWIENKNVVQAEIINGHTIIKSLQVGKSYVRLDKSLILFEVSPIGTRETLSKWQKLLKTFTGVEIKRCDFAICLYGNLTEFKHYLRFINLIEEYSAPIQMALTISSDLQKEIQKYIARKLREHGLTPQKIIFAGRWRTYYKPTSINKTLKNQLEKLGVELIAHENATQLADNVQVSVQIVELNKSFFRKLGVSWPDQYRAQILNFEKLQATPAFDLALNAAEGAGQAKILASPKLVCRSGKEADFFAGGEFPVKVTNARSSHIEWKKYGIGLRLKPQLDPIGQLNLQIETEISSVDMSLKVDDMPAVQTNRVSSFFDMINDKTISLSGLLKNETSQNSEGLPFFKNIPILGELFKSRNFIENKSELFIFVTPRLVSPENESEP